MSPNKVSLAVFEALVFQLEQGNLTGTCNVIGDGEHLNLYANNDV